MITSTLKIAWQDINFFQYYLALYNYFFSKFIIHYKSKKKKPFSRMASPQSNFKNVYYENKTFTQFLLNYPLKPDRDSTIFLRASELCGTNGIRP